MKNSVLLYGKLVSSIEFRSKVEDGSELYECLVEVQNKSIHGGMIRDLNKSVICLIYRIYRGFDKTDTQFRQEQLWMSLQIGDLVKIEGKIAQDRVNRLGTSSVFVTGITKLTELTETQGNASAVITGTIYKKPPLLRTLDNGSIKLTFLLDQTHQDVSMKVYVVAWNNMANYINELGLSVGDKIEVGGNIVSRPYFDKRTNVSLNLCELLAKRVTILDKVNESNEQERSKVVDKS